MGDHLGAEHGTQELLGNGAKGHPGRGFPGGGALQHRPGVVEPVFLHAGQVGMTRPRPGQRGIAGKPGENLRVDRVGGHDLLPLRPLRVADLHCERATQRNAVPDPAEQCDLVLFELHPSAAAVTEAPTGQLGGDIGRGHRNTCRQSFEDGNQGGTMRFTCGEPAQHAGNPPTSAEPGRPPPDCNPDLRAQRHVTGPLTPAMRPWADWSPVRRTQWHVTGPLTPAMRPWADWKVRAAPAAGQRPWARWQAGPPTAGHAPVGGCRTGPSAGSRSPRTAR